MGNREFEQCNMGVFADFAGPPACYSKGRIAVTLHVSICIANFSSMGPGRGLQRFVLKAPYICAADGLVCHQLCHIG